jgi:acetyl-CoA acetyltransferase
MNAHAHLAAGRGEFAIAGGMESMTNSPYAVPDYRKGRRYGNTTFRDTMIYDALWEVPYDARMGEVTEALVEREGITRERQDEYALEPNRRAARATEEGLFDDEIVPVETLDGVVDTDEGPRGDTSLEANDLAVEDVDRFEVNEAFAAQMIHVMDRVGVPHDRLNTRGGAVAYGHPIGASGGMIAASLLYELEPEDLARGFVGMSVGGGGGVMAMLERP